MIPLLERTTAETANMYAAQGRVTLEDLQEWATTQNKFCFSIQWRVGEKEHYLNNEGTAHVLTPYLYDVPYKD